MKKNNADALRLLVLPTILALVFFNTLESGLLLYICGQLCGALFLAQCFILMHEFGHNSFFKSSKLNSFMGWIVSPFTFIPFFNWYKFHNLHHEWTGWRDKDPTTEGTFAEDLSDKQVKIVNFCWKYSIPIFSMGYRFGTYWNTDKSQRFLKSENDQLKHKFFMRLYLAFYIVLMISAPSFFINLIPAIYLSFIITDIIMLSQHAHIEMPVAKGQDVSPLKYTEQSQYSRSILLPYKVAKFFFFNFNLHEAHHAYPGLPCYFLPQIKVNSTNSYRFWPWLRKVKSMEGVEYIFRTSKVRDGF